MDREILRQEAKYYAAYAQELREKFRNGLLSELVPYPQFVVWKHQWIDGKPKKPPYNPKTHILADTTDPQSWGTLSQALKALSSGRYNGIGFVFAESDPFSGMDIDHCVGNNRSIDTWARDIIADINSYTEYSPTDGVHILTEGSFPGPGRKIDNLEMFHTHHFLTLTLNHVPGTPTAIEKRQVEQGYLYLTRVPEELRHTQNKNTRGSLVGPQWQREPPADEEADRRVIDEALSAANGARFARYWEGDPTLWTGDETKRERSSKSEADFTLVLLLLTRTGDNVEQVKRLFRRSGLYDPHKTERIRGRDPTTGQPVTYLEMTIFNALRKRKTTQKKGQLPDAAK